MDGRKGLLGLWLSENEGAKFWLGVLAELQNRGRQGHPHCLGNCSCVALPPASMQSCVDGLKGFPDAINAVFPNTRIQLCLAHRVRNSVKYVPWKGYKAVTADLKLIYQSPSPRLGPCWRLSNSPPAGIGKYPQISRPWRAHWHNLNTLSGYPEDIRKAVCTTNAIESLNSVIRKAVQKRKLFSTDESAKKVVYLAIQEASQKWTMPTKNWKPALNRFMIEFEDRLQDYV